MNNNVQECLRVIAATFILLDIFLVKVLFSAIVLYTLPYIYQNCYIPELLYACHGRTRSASSKNVPFHPPRLVMFSA